MNCPSSHSSTRIHDAILFYHPLVLQPHVLFHLQSFPLFTNILGLLYSKNKTKQNIQTNKNLPLTPTTLSTSHPFFSFLFSRQISCPFSWVPSPYLPVFAPSKWLPPKSISTLLPSQLFSIFLNLSLQHWEPLATCCQHPACLALPCPGVFPVLLTITSLPPSVALSVSRFSLRYSPEFYICLSPLPPISFLALWVPSGFTSHHFNFPLHANYFSNLYLCPTFPPGYLNSSSPLNPCNGNKAQWKRPWIYASKRCGSQFWLSHLPALKLGRALWATVSSSINWRS